MSQGEREDAREAMVARVALVVACALAVAALSVGSGRGCEQVPEPVPAVRS